MVMHVGSHSQCLSQPILFYRVYWNIQTARRRLMRMAGNGQYDTSKDRVDHMAVGDYKRMCAIIRDCPGDYSESIAQDDVFEPTSLPYSVGVVDYLPLIIGDVEDC